MPALDHRRPLEPNCGNIVGAVSVRLVGAVLMEQHDEWQLQHRYMQLEAMAELTPTDSDTQPLQLPPRAA